MIEKNEPDIEINLQNYEVLLKKYRPLILSTIKKVHKIYDSSFRVEFEDLYQESCLAVYDSIKHFDPKRGVFFGVYLKFAISNRCKCFCRNTTPHYYSKDVENSTTEKTRFKRERVQVGSMEDIKSYLL